MATPVETTVGPKASRARVWDAVDRIVRSGRRPTVDGVRELLGGGSPNSVTAYINEWYQELGRRLDAAETPVSGLPREALSLLVELWRIAKDAGAADGDPSEESLSELTAAERKALVAESRALEMLNMELHKHRASAEQSLADARALLARREAALDEERKRAAALDQTLAHARLELAVALERQRLVPGRAIRTKNPRRHATARRIPTAKAAKGRSKPRGSSRPRFKAGKTAASPRSSRRSTTRKRK